MHVRLLAAAALALAGVAAAPAHAFAGPDANYLQNALDGRGRCLGSADGKVAMVACDKSPSQQWVMAPGDLPGYYKLQTLDAPRMCLAAQLDDRHNQVAMQPCGTADSQQWYLERLSEVPRRLRFTNRAVGWTRCLESQQTGLKLTPCSRRQAGHFWHADYLPTM